MTQRECPKCPPIHGVMVDETREIPRKGGKQETSVKAVIPNAVLF